MGYTHHDPSGNRTVTQGFLLVNAARENHSLPGAPEWLAPVPGTSPPSVVAVLESGDTVGVVFGDDGSRRTEVQPNTRNGPPAAIRQEENDGARLLISGSPLTHPVGLPQGIAFVRGDGTVVLRGRTDARLAVDALPDARLSRANGRVWLFAGRTDEYGHGVLGDRVEGTQAVCVDPVQGEVRTRHRPPSGSVIEDLVPLVADIDDDGDDEIVTTVADRESGGRLAALGSGGRYLGPGFDTGFRWRHGLAVAPFGPGGETELAAVRTPHIGGTVEFYRARDGRLDRVASRDGYSSHVLGSRNLDMAVAGRFAGTDRPALVVPTDDRRSLAVLVRAEQDVREVGRVQLGGGLTSNLTAAADGQVLVAGTKDGLRFWDGR